MAKKEWLGWLKCNVLEIIILILVLVLLVKVYSAPAVENLPALPEVTAEEPLTEAAAPAVPVEGAVTEETPAAEETPTG